ncbi:alpha/beta hydrolase, partial [Pseudomonas aeruginosa]|nr:alpha/beta hydrolase [Pseudomonas aeruginosa]
MSATPYLLQPPLAVGFARLGFGSLSLESLRERYAAPSSGSRFIELDGFPLHYRD